MDAYGVGWSPADVVSMAMWYLAHAKANGIPKQLSKTEIKELVCANFSVTTLHYVEDEEEWAKQARCPVGWSETEDDCDAQGSRSMGLHTKFWIVDESAFYIGSQNLYPNNLAEYGLIIDEADVANEAENILWKPLWAASAKYAPSGPQSDRKKCENEITIPT